MDNPAVLLLSEVYGRLKGGISTIYRRLAQVLREHEPDTPLLSVVLEATEEDKEDATHDKVELLLPEIQPGDQRTKPNLGWMTFDHRAKYPHLPPNVKVIVGHTDGTSRAACGIQQDRYSEAKVILFIDDIPEETEQYKGDEKAMGIGKKEDCILEDAQHADVVFSIGDRIFDHFENQFRAIPEGNQPQHVKVVPRPSSIFEDVDARYVDTGTMVVLCISRVAGVEKLNGLDLAVGALSIVAQKIPIKLRVRGVNKEDKQAREAILELCKSANLQITFLPYGTQKDIRKDMLQAHLVLVPSRAEPFGFVGLEAIAVGVPVLVSDKSGLADLINKFSGYHHCIVETDLGGDEQRNIVHWASCIKRVLQHCEAEFATAASLKKKLLSSRYWEESERKFIDVCTSEGASSAGFRDNITGRGTQDNEGSLESSSDEESVKQEYYRIIRISDKIFHEEVLNDPQKLESRLLDFKQHVDGALDMFKLSCKAKLRVKKKLKKKAKYKAAKVHGSLFSGRNLGSRYGKMVECFKMYCATLKKVVDGCVLCSLEFDDIPHLASFLRGYRDGKLSETLTQELITEEMKQEEGADLYVHVTLLVARDTARSDDEDLSSEECIPPVFNDPDYFNPEDDVPEAGWQRLLPPTAVKTAYEMEGVQLTLVELGALLDRLDTSQLKDPHIAHQLNLARLNSETRQASDAMMNCITALAAAKEAGNEAELMEIYFWMGEMHRQLRSQNNAIQSYEQYLTLVTDREKEGLAHNRLGLSHYEIRDYDKGHQHHEISLAASEDDNDTKGTVMAHVNLGNTARLLDKLDQAKSHFDTALEMAEWTWDQHGQMEANFWMGEMHREQLHSPQSAITYYERHLARAEELADRDEKRVAYNRLGMTYYETEQYEEALRYHHKSLESLEIEGNEGLDRKHPVHANLGDCYRALGKLELAKHYYRLTLSVKTDHKQRYTNISMKLLSLEHIS
ncbi:uncharacterized protein LOC144922731 [Branchiostoma floridae x Branchiostoma belcheri]